MTDFRAIASKALTNKEFCEKLIKNPEETLKENGVIPTPEILETLKKADVNGIQNIANDKLREMFSNWI